MAQLIPLIALGSTAYVVYQALTAQVGTNRELKSPTIKLESTGDKSMFRDVLQMKNEPATIISGTQDFTIVSIRGLNYTFPNIQFTKLIGDGNLLIQVPPEFLARTHEGDVVNKTKTNIKPPMTTVPLPTLAAVTPSDRKEMSIKKLKELGPVVKRL